MKWLLTHFSRLRRCDAKYVACMGGKRRLLDQRILARSNSSPRCHGSPLEGPRGILAGEPHVGQSGVMRTGTGLMQVRTSIGGGRYMGVFEMPWTYSQSTGELRQDGALTGTGYSGAGLTAATGRNNPAMEAIENVGPIPQGLYTIGPIHNSTNTGPNVLNLTPNGHDALGRTDFQIHGNNATNDASHGCVIMPPTVRTTVSNSGDDQLTVIP